MKIVKNFPNRIAAEQAQLYLRAMKIESLVQCSDAAMFGSCGSSFPQGADLYVVEEDYERAKDYVYNIFDGI